MKQRNDFVSNSSSSCSLVAIDSKNHDPKKWLKNTLYIQPDNQKVMMEFNDYESDSYTSKNDVSENWKFICSQVIYWIESALVFNGESVKSKAKILRHINNHPDFIVLNDAVAAYLGPDCKGIEFDSEDLREIKDETYGTVTKFIPSWGLNHESIFDGFDDMMKHAKCTSIPELIWGISKIEFL